MKSFSSANVRDMHDNIKTIYGRNPNTSNDALTLPPNEILDKILELKKKIEKINKDCKVIILTLTYLFDNQKAGNTVIQLWFRYRICLIFSSPLPYI